MTLQEFIPILQARPFRAFRIRTTRGQFDVNYPLGAALTAQLRVIVVVEDTRVESFSLDEIKECAMFGQPMSLDKAMSAVPAETLARHAQLLAEAQEPAEPETSAQSSHASDPGKLDVLHSRTTNGIHVVQVTVQTRNGQSMLSTTGTRWNAHGVEQFENGTSLYLHHLDHPTVEQRIILWPPDRGTFESFAEAKSVIALTKELHRRDAKLAARPAKPLKPSAAYFRKIDVTWEISEPDGWEQAFGEENPALDPARYEFVLVPHRTDGRREVHNPCLTDMMKEEIIFNLVDTDWDATGQQDNRMWHLSLRHASSSEIEIVLHIDVDRRAAMINDETTLLPLGWIERHLRNLALYEQWNVMFGALLAGPVKRKHPDVVLLLAAGFRAELWAGEPRFSMPFLQPHIVDAEGRTVFDLRDTTWSASIRTNPDRPTVTLQFSSGVEESRDTENRCRMEFDLVTHRVTCRNLEGSTTIGMMQAMVRRVRGIKWMLEDVPKWFEKSRPLWKQS